MITKTHKRLIVLCCLIILSLGLTGLALARIAAQAKTLDRDLEPVVVPGVRVGKLIDTPVEQLFVYTYTGSDWVQAPLQVDEKTTTGDYTDTEDSLFDANDEIVFMAADLGEEAPDTPVISVTLPISSSWYKLEVTDPTAPTKKGWAYLVRSNTLTHSTTTDYVDYDGGNNRIVADSYQLGVETANHPGFNYLALNNNATNILDRTKLRAVVDAGLFGGLTTFTEEDINEAVSVTLIKDGPVRVIVRQSARDSLPLDDASVDSTLLGYAALVQATSDISFTLNAGDLSTIRSSFDFRSTASGATFYNAQTPAGVIIDGTPDAVPTNTLSSWSQISHTSGRAIQIIDSTSVGGTPTTFYRDDSTPEPTADNSQETGNETGSYGESGLLFSGSVNNQSTIENWLLVLPPGGNVGNTYQGYFDNRLQFSAIPGEGFASVVYLPLITK